MIVPIVGEELGLLGVLGLLVAFGLLAWCGYSVALRAKDPFGKLLAAGLTTLIVGQALLNIGGTLGVLPFTGVPVPLISYGGTSLIATLAAIGLVLSVGTYGGQALRSPSPCAGRRASRPRDAARRRAHRRQRARPRRALRARGAAGRCDAAARPDRGRRHGRPRHARAGRGRGAGARRAEVTFAGTPERAEAQLVPAAGYAFDAVPRARACRARPRCALARALALDAAAPLRLRAHPAPPAAARRARRRRLRGRPDAGGGPCAPDPARADRGRCAPRPRQPAWPRRWPIASSWPTRCPGGSRRTTRSSDARSRAPTSRRRGREARAELGLPQDAFVLAVFGALAGARRINEALRRAPTAPTGSRTASSCTSPERATTSGSSRRS